MLNYFYFIISIYAVLSPNLRKLEKVPKASRKK